MNGADGALPSWDEADESEHKSHRGSSVTPQLRPWPREGKPGSLQG